MMMDSGDNPLRRKILEMQKQQSPIAQSPDILPPQGGQKQYDYGDTSRFTGMQVDPELSKVHGTGTPFMPKPEETAANKKMAAGMLGAIGQAFSQPQEEPMPEMKWMPNQGIIPKQQQQSPPIFQSGSQLGQATLL